MPPYKTIPRPHQNPNPGSSNQERKQRERVQRIEEEISVLEIQLAAISRQLENPPSDPSKVQHLGQEYVRSTEHPGSADGRMDSP